MVTYDTSLTMSSPRSIVAVFAEFLQLPEKETQVGAPPHRHLFSTQNNTPRFLPTQCPGL